MTDTLKKTRTSMTRWSAATLAMIGVAFVLCGCLPLDQILEEEISRIVRDELGQAGQTGPAGPGGEEGTEGTAGAQGEQGAAGAQGEQGAAGQGEQGAAGGQGKQGSPGPEGQQGPPGTDGGQGPTGPEGEQGPPGSEGEQGPPGADGEQGAPGADGEQGLPGLACWDLDGDGERDLPDEDLNGDGVVDVHDCQAVVFAGEGLIKDIDTIALDTEFTDSRYWQVGGNAASAPQALGTLGQAALELIVNGLRAFRIEPGGISVNLIGGFNDNAVDDGAVGATIAGGGSEDDGLGNDASNRVADDFGTVSGGRRNLAGSNDGDPTNAGYATVGGGFANVASAQGATVPGGEENHATSPFSFAAGRQARAIHQGAFVWADSTNEECSSIREDEFRVRASGGAAFNLGATRFVSMRASGGRLIDTSTNAFLSLGGAWTNASSRDNKDNLDPVDVRVVLMQLVGMPIYTWNYTAEQESIRHMGPMAQDFYAIFELGYDDETIPTVDAEGVALAAVQGLYLVLQEQEALINSQTHRIRDLQRETATLKQRLEALETLVRKP